MNIFEVLSQGKSRLHEPSISAMLGYLLDPLENHGLGDTFLRDFLKMLDTNNERNIRLTINSYSNRIITADKLNKKRTANTIYSK